MLKNPDDPDAQRAFATRPLEELYDLRKDPGQLVNVVGDKNYRSTRRFLRELLASQLIASRDPRYIANPFVFAR